MTWVPWGQRIVTGYHPVNLDRVSWVTDSISGRDLYLSVQIVVRFDFSRYRTRQRRNVAGPLFPSLVHRAIFQWTSVHRNPLPIFSGWRVGRHPMSNWTKKISSLKKRAPRERRCITKGYSWSMRDFTWNGQRIIIGAFDHWLDERYFNLLEIVEKLLHQKKDSLFQVTNVTRKLFPRIVIGLSDDDFLRWSFSRAKSSPKEFLHSKHLLGNGIVPKRVGLVGSLALHRGSEERNSPWNFLRRHCSRPPGRTTIFQSFSLNGRMEWKWNVALSHQCWRSGTKPDGKSTRRSTAAAWTEVCFLPNAGHLFFSPFWSSE